MLAMGVLLDTLHHNIFMRSMRPKSFLRGYAQEEDRR